MTWEQEMKDQAHLLAEEWAPVMARDMAQELAKDMAQDMAKELAEEKAVETAKNFILKNFEPSVIAECTGLPLEQVLQLQKELQSTN